MKVCYSCYSTAWRGGNSSKNSNLAVATPGDAKTEGTAPLWWRVSITEPGGKVFEVDTPERGWTLPDWRAYADRNADREAARTRLSWSPSKRPYA